MEPIPNFTEYSDIVDYVRQKVKEHGQRYYATDEYKSLYPTIKKMYDVEHGKFKTKKQAELDQSGIVPGDKIEITFATMFGGLDSVVGTLFMKNGIPHVKLPTKMAVSKNGQITYKQSIPYSTKNMNKLQESKLKRLLKPIVESILNEVYTENDLNFIKGKAEIKQGRKVLAKIIDRNVFYKAHNLKSTFSPKFPFSLEIGGSMRECESLEDALFYLNKYVK